MTIALASSSGPSRETVEDYLPLVRSVARRYARRGEELDDLVQVGALGLLCALDRYRPERGPFLPYALVTVTGEIRRHLRDRSDAVRLPRGLSELRDRLPSLEIELRAALGREPTAAELAGAAGADARAVAEARTGSAAPGPLPEGLEADDPVRDADDRLFLLDSLRGLDPRSRRIVHLHHVCGLSQAEVARVVGLSPAQVSRLLRRALETMRTRAGVAA